MKLLDDYRDDESIYVRSKTNTDFNMVIKINGEAIAILIPSTFIPLDLRMFAATADLKKSMDLRSAIRSGILELVDEKDAIQELQSKEGAREYERIKKLFNVVSDTLRQPVSESSDLNIAAISDMDEVNTKIMEIMIDTTTTPDDKYNLVYSLNKRQPLTKTDLEYIKSSAPEHCTELLDFVDSELEKFSNEGLRKYVK